ncbi:type I-B CRISPR-associated protein Cas8b1/Cst1 [Candidatus Enterococcus clewellii]|uniref:CRISPR-associated protein cst1 n=1 Tax=Candidatus Enterococcus clewellii TaxID=1834193 RepID=A0A242K8H3_9ENTE|nr:type I-B CRISPR-associated protein Cas8b1/Cst1 [Enterococcus sp. 9E7_DIV0242]OTP17367.1 hypothetical protein A5888_001505 [Enterococcus sp. 9E7_DIV0242]
MEGKVSLYLGDWQFNAGLIGLVNVLGRENVELAYDHIVFDLNQLDRFEEAYFAYFIKTYKKLLSWHKIVSYKQRLVQFESDDFEQFTETDLENLNKYIKDILKYYLKSASYKAAYSLIPSDTDVLALEKEIKTVGKMKKGETFADKKPEIIQEIKEQLPKLKEAIDFCESSQGKKYLAAKNVIYTVIKNGWNGVSFLNPQTKIPDMYVDYAATFVQPAKVYLEENEEEQTKYKYHCANCNRKIKDLKNDVSFLNATGFDVSRKAGHVWDSFNDTAVCPLCKLVYSCVSAGFTYVYNDGMFINASTNLDDLYRMNYTLKHETLNAGGENISEVSPYRALIQNLQKKDLQEQKQQLEDVTLVRYENETYRFNILPTNSLRTIELANKQLEVLIPTGFKEINTNFRIYKLVLQSLFNQENLFYLIHKLLYFKLTNVGNLYYQPFHVRNIIEINSIFLGGLNHMTEEKTKTLPGDISWRVNHLGEKFKAEYSARFNENKLITIAHQMLGALKINNRDRFMDVLLNCYSYINKPVPKTLLDVFSSDENFKTIGYSFVAGIIGKTEKTTEEEK